MERLALEQVAELPGRVLAMAQVPGLGLVLATEAGPVVVTQGQLDQTQAMPAKAHFSNRSARAALPQVAKVGLLAMAARARVKNPRRSRKP